MEIWQDLSLLFGENFQKSMIFGFSSIFIALTVVAADWCYCTIGKKKSILGLQYEKPNKILFAYVLGAGIVGFLGLLGNFLNYNIQAVLGVGVGWPYIFIQIIKSRESEVPDQRISEEE